ncbi:UDP-N-acetylmuramoyl-tripeptide--D-alanyl-D-alanine ligase [Candidatus Wolfebacteria bacterium]|nr:UDP-N-acetylmuramoyl-tripeptide--D-alanyl-D-alanine ligase [Candidatus Wolfebacteria bacterium]
MKKIPIKILQRLLGRLAKMIIWRFNPKIIAITGSVGKTSTKEAIYAVLKDHFSVRKSVGNLNNELGTPLAIITDWTDERFKIISRSEPAGKKKIRKLFFWMMAISAGLKRFFFGKKSGYPEILILEYGADRPGDIAYLCEMARPHIGVVTSVGEIPVHVEFFSGPEAVAKEKSKLVEYLLVSGFIVLNFDNALVKQMKEKTRGKVIGFGFGADANVKIGSFEARTENGWPAGVSFKLEYGGSFVPVVMKNSFGKGQVYAASAAACVGLIFDLNLVEISEGLSKNYAPPKSRLNLIKGVKETCVIDDSYNASPLSMKEALETIKDFQAERKIAVLGDMLELGEYSQNEHEKIGKLTVGIVDVLITVGPQAKFIAKAAIGAGFPAEKIKSFDTTVPEVASAIREIMGKGDLVLVKASRGIGLDKIVDEIKIL